MDPRMTTDVPSVDEPSSAAPPVRRVWPVSGAHAVALRMVFGAAVAVALVAMTPDAAMASPAGAAMPWDAPLDRLLQNFTGPTARALVIIAIVGCGLFWAFTRNEEGLKKLGQIAFGGAIALGAVTLVSNLGFSAAII